MSEDYFMCELCKRITEIKHCADFCVDAFYRDFAYCKKCYDDEMCNESTLDRDAYIWNHEEKWIPTKYFFARHARSCLEKIRELTKEVDVCTQECLPNEGDSLEEEDAQY